MKAITARINAAQSLRESAQRAAVCGQYARAAEDYLRAGKLFWASGQRLVAEQSWRKACRFCLKEAERIARQHGNLN